MNIYRVSDRLKVFIFLFALLQILTVGSLLLIPFISLPAHSLAWKLYTLCCSSIYLYYLAPLLIFALMLMGTLLILHVFKRKVIFTNDSIISKDIFKSSRLKFSEIKGFVIKRSILYVITNSNKRIVVNLMSFEKADNLVRNLEMRFSNLDL
ncbi:hypothetical protein BKM63_05735 [Flavobacterium johnsoniae]|uniref:DUF304 domain-containing protein n=1 Tax=Flavobacterium johnsoniae TaxID=986 RepID=A0A1J7BUX9_FLAJO|nr:hypothetical protein BKM63_05735 [Flavobacterium johnsoniae]